MNWHALAALLLAWVGYRVVTVAVLPFLRERGFGGGSGEEGRAFRAELQGGQGGSGVAGSFVTMVAGAGMLALIVLGAHGIAARFLLDAVSMDFWPVAGLALPPLLSLGLVAFALGYAPRGLAGLVDCFALAALALLLVYNFAGAPAEGAILVFRWMAAAGFAAAAMILSARLLSAGSGMAARAGLVAVAVVAVEAGVMVGANLLAVAAGVVAAGMMAGPVAFVVAAAAGWCRLSVIAVLAVTALTLSLLPTNLPVRRIVESMLQNPETYALLPAVFMLALARAMAVYSRALLPSSRHEERRSPPVAAFQWLVAAISAIPKTIGLQPFVGGRQVSLAMLLPFGLPMLLMGEVAGSSPSTFAAALVVPFLVLLGVCALWPREGFEVSEAASGRVFVGAALVLAVFWLMFAGIGTVMEVTALAAGLCCLLLARRAGGYAVLVAQGGAVADCALFAMVLVLANVIHVTSRFGMMSFMQSDWFLLTEGIEIPAMLALAVMLGASVGTLAAAVLLSLLYYILAVTAFDVESFSVMLLLAAETGRYARVSYLRTAEDAGVDMPWLLSLAGLTLAYLALLLT